MEQLLQRADLCLAQLMPAGVDMVEDLRPLPSQPVDQTDRTRKWPDRIILSTCDQDLALCKVCIRVGLPSDEGVQECDSIKELWLIQKDRGQDICAI